MPPHGLRGSQHCGVQSLPWGGGAGFICSAVLPVMERVVQNVGCAWSDQGLLGGFLARTRAWAFLRAGRGLQRAAVLGPGTSLPAPGCCSRIRTPQPLPGLQHTPLWVTEEHGQVDAIMMDEILMPVFADGLRIICNPEVSWGYLFVLNILILK